MCVTPNKNEKNPVKRSHEEREYVSCRIMSIQRLLFDLQAECVRNMSSDAAQAIRNAMRELGLAEQHYLASHKVKKEANDQGRSGCQ